MVVIVNHSPVPGLAGGDRRPILFNQMLFQCPVMHAGVFVSLICCLIDNVLRALSHASLEGTNLT